MLVICQFPLIPDCEFLSSLGFGLADGAVDLQANIKPGNTSNNNSLCININFKIITNLKLLLKNTSYTPTIGFRVFIRVINKHNSYLLYLQDRVRTLLMMDILNLGN